jgi:hypothetical protein
VADAVLLLPVPDQGWVRLTIAADQLPVGRLIEDRDVVRMGQVVAPRARHHALAWLTGAALGRGLGVLRRCVVRAVRLGDRHRAPDARQADGPRRRGEELGRQLGVLDHEAAEDLCVAGAERAHARVEGGRQAVVLRRGCPIRVLALLGGDVVKLLANHRLPAEYARRRRWLPGAIRFC